MAKSLFSGLAALAVAVLAPTTAHAVIPLSSYGFDFSCASRAGGCPAGEDSLTFSTLSGNSMTFTSTTDNKLQVKVTAWSIDRGTSDSDKSTDIVKQAALRLWEGGLGVQNQYEKNESPNHSIDSGVDLSNITYGSNKYMVDFVMLQFNWNVDLNTMATGWINGDADASVRMGPNITGTPAGWSSTPSLNNKNVLGTAANAIELQDYVDVNSAMANSAGMNPEYNGTSSRNIDSGNNAQGKPNSGMIWIIGAFYGTQTNDYFKLDALNVTVFPTIPEPSTWMTMILGFGFVGATMRRRKPALGKGARLPA